MCNFSQARCSVGGSVICVARAMKVCPDCPTITAAGRCGTCARRVDRQRGSRQERGYGAAHDRLRAEWAPLVEACAVLCARCEKPILRGQRWAMDHNDDRTGYLGPSHKLCNDAAGGRKAGSSHA